mmetsp:Transcript_11116/g.23179  ORF Transcript_11116/g.23179 Transcript_11116/m.23179 type:complete len:379 (+) Transcript_11116:308-1444(+)
MESRYCLFENVYYDIARNTFVYHVHPLRRELPVFYERTGPIYSFPAEFVNLQPKRKKYAGSTLHMEARDEPPDPDEVRDLTGSYVLWEEVNEENWAHFLSDTLFPLFTVLYDFTQDISRVQEYQVLLADHCQKTYGIAGTLCPPSPNCSSSRLFEKYNLVFDNPVACWRDVKDTHSGGRKFLRFATLVAGGGNLATKPSEEENKANQGRSLLWWSFRQHIVGRVGGTMERPVEPKIVIVNKELGRRQIRNMQETYAAINNTFPCEVVMYTGGKLSAAEEIRLVSGATVYITPPGGISFSIPFLWRRCATILVSFNSYGKRKDGVGFVESDVLWRRLAFTRIFHYEAVSASDTDRKAPHMYIEPKEFVRFIQSIMSSEL